MSRIRFIQGLLKNLNQEIPENSFAYLTQEEAYRVLKALTDQDFGYDVQAGKNGSRRTRFLQNT